jgi:hypothetical protein
MAAEASEPELSGIDPPDNTRCGDPSQNYGQAAMCASGIRAPTPRAKHRPLPRQTFSFISSSAAAHAPAEAAYLARPTPTLAEISLSGLPIRKCLQTSRTADAQQCCAPAMACMGERPLRRPSECPTVSVR